MLKCGHVIGYQEFSCGHVLCMKCQPPATTPQRVGLVQPDGTIKTKWDILADICDANRRASTDMGLKMMNEWWPDGEWEVVDPGQVDGNGWPVASKGWRGIGNFQCILDAGKALQRPVVV